MQLIELTEKDKLEFNRFVAESANGSFLQAWDWGDWQESLGRKANRFWLVGEAGERLGSMQLLETPLPFGQFYLYAPYGPVVKEHFWKTENLKVLKTELKTRFPKAVFLRIEPKILPFNPAEIFQKAKNIQPGKTLVVDLSKSLDQLLAQMHHKTRYNIHVAEKHGVEIKNEFDITVGHGLFAREAADLIVQTAVRQNYHGYPQNYYQKLADFFAMQNRGGIKLGIYKAIYQNQLLVSAVMLDFGDTRTFLFGGSSEENRNVMAPYLLHWQAICDAQARGLKFYDFWGTETSSGKTAGFVRFKLGFGGQEKVYGGAWEAGFKPVAYYAYRCLKKIRN